MGAAHTENKITTTHSDGSDVPPNKEYSLSMAEGLRETHSIAIPNMKASQAQVQELLASPLSPRASSKQSQRRDETKENNKLKEQIQKLKVELDKKEEEL